MNMQLSPKVVVVVILIAVVAVAGAMALVWRAPSAGRASGEEARKGAYAAGPAAPDAATMQKIQEWKKQHPNATTRW